jgi:hypothetical protein
LRFFGLYPSRRAIFTTSGEGSAEASVAELAAFEADAVESVPAAAGAVSGDVAVDEAGAAGVGALLSVVADAGDWAPQGAAATSRSDAKIAIR